METTHNILIVDDDQGTLQILSLILENAGYNVVTDLTGDLEFLRSGQFPDLILLDNQLGEKSGASICYSLKQNIQTRHIPVILESGSQDLDSLASTACADDFIPKPYSIKLLLSKVEVLLAKRSAIAC